MHPLRRLRHTLCLLLALALLQAAVPVRAWASSLSGDDSRQAGTGATLRWVCTSMGLRAVVDDDGSSSSQPVTPADDGGGHCLLCAVAALPSGGAAAGVPAVPLSAPALPSRGDVRVGRHACPVPPATGPPARS